MQAAIEYRQPHPLVAQMRRDHRTYWARCRKDARGSRAFALQGTVLAHYGTAKVSVRRRLQYRTLINRLGAIIEGAQP